MNIYQRVEKGFNTNDISCAPQSHRYKISCAYFDILSGRPLTSGRLGHSHSINNPDRLCYEFTKHDIVNCYYLFGETILHTTHKVGCCPWKIGIYAIQKEDM